MLEKTTYLPIRQHSDQMMAALSPYDKRDEDPIASHIKLGKVILVKL